MRLPIFVVDAFTDRVFGGNPAAVCPLPHWLDDAVLGAIAAQNNLSETAFFVAEGSDRFALRWFTPTAEVDLCGHATLASAFVLTRLMDAAPSITFSTLRAGNLTVQTRDDALVLDLPARPAEPVEVTPELAGACGEAPVEAWKATKLMAVLENEDAVRRARPKLDTVARLDADGLILTARGSSVDFVSRYFAPHIGIPEDPVTGSAHCTLTPFWAERLGKSRLQARQLSARGGELTCELAGNRVLLEGRAALYLRGEIDVPQ